MGAKDGALVLIREASASYPTERPKPSLKFVSGAREDNKDEREKSGLSGGSFLMGSFGVCSRCKKSAFVLPPDFSRFVYLSIFKIFLLRDDKREMHNKTKP